MNQHNRTTGIRKWLPTYSLATLLSGAAIVGMFFSLLLAPLHQIPIAVFVGILRFFACCSALAPVAMWFLPTSKRWLLWMVVYLLIFLGSRYGIDEPAGVYLALGAAVGTLAGLVVNQIRDGVEEGNVRPASPPSYGLAVLGFLAGVICTAATLIPLGMATDPLRGQVVPPPTYFGAARAYDDEVNILLAVIYVVIALCTLRGLLVARRFGWWKGVCFGMFVSGTSLGVLWLIFH